MGAKIVSMGYAFPPLRVTNELWREQFATKKELLGNEFTRFITDGIEQRYYMGAGAAVADLGAQAALDCLRRADVPPDAVDHIIHMANVGDAFINGDGPRIQDRIGARHASTVDLTGVSCAGFLIGLDLATALIEARRHRRILLTCVSNVATRAADHRDVSASSVGDLATAILVCASEGECGQLGYRHETRGEFYALHTHREVSEGQRTWADDAARPWGRHFFYIDHRDGIAAAQRGAAEFAPAAARRALEQAGKTTGEIDWFVTHQPGKAPMQLWDMLLGIPSEKHPHTLGEIGNSSFCTIPFTLARLREQERLKDRQHLLFLTPASGQHVVAMVWRW
jgi:3-oxoacyl-[acyl-carrier-protein] synthase III